MIVTRAEIIVQQGYPSLLLQFKEPELPDATINFECGKHLIHRKWNAVYLGGMWSDLTSVTINGEERRGFTSNPAVLKLARKFIDAMAERTVESRVIFEA